MCGSIIRSKLPWYVHWLGITTRFTHCIHPHVQEYLEYVFFLQDLVKKHLMSAVKDEVDELKEKIKDLEQENVRLRTETQMLRSVLPNELQAQVGQIQVLGYSRFEPLSERAYIFSICLYKPM